jgi:hypothetical protein
VTAPSSGDRRARLLAYGRIQARDWIVDRGVLIAVLLLVMGASNVYSIRAAMGADWATGDEGHARALTVYDAVLQILAYAGPLFGANGIVSTDRQRGYFRLLFARPVGVARYYAQLFIINGVGLLVVAALTALVFSTFVAPVSVGGTVAYAAIAWMVIGGAGFLVSTITHADGIVVVFLLVGNALLHAYMVAVRVSGGDVGPLFAGLDYLLPPVHLFGSFRATLLRDVPAVTAEFARAIGFGAVCLAAGLLIVHRRPLAR